MVKNPNLSQIVLDLAGNEIAKLEGDPTVELSKQYDYTPKKVEEIPEDMMTLATEIAKMSDLLQKVVGSGLQKRTIILLLQGQTKLGVTTVTKVVDAMLNMKTHWTKIK